MKLQQTLHQIKKSLQEQKNEFKSFFIYLLIFNFTIITIFELTIIHPLEIFKKQKYQEKKIEKHEEK